MSDERYDPKQAAYHARQGPREKSAPPHHLRCDWFRGDTRCQLADGHGEKHKYAEPA